MKMRGEEVVYSSTSFSVLCPTPAPPPPPPAPPAPPFRGNLRGNRTRTTSSKGGGRSRAQRGGEGERSPAPERSFNLPMDTLSRRGARESGPWRGGHHLDGHAVTRVCHSAANFQGRWCRGRGAMPLLTAPRRVASESSTKAGVVVCCDHGVTPSVPRHGDGGAGEIWLPRLSRGSHVFFSGGCREFFGPQMRGPAEDRRAAPAGPWFVKCQTLGSAGAYGLPNRIPRHRLDSRPWNEVLCKSSSLRVHAVAALFSTRRLRPLDAKPPSLVLARERVGAVQISCQANANNAFSAC